MFIDVLLVFKGCNCGVFNFLVGGILFMLNGDVVIFIVLVVFWLLCILVILLVIIVNVGGGLVEFDLNVGVMLDDDGWIYFDFCDFFYVLIFF